jgi:hypothetical protein
MNCQYWFWVCSRFRAADVWPAPSELNLSVVQFLPSLVFNSNHFLQFCVCPMLILCRDKREAKCRQSENPKLSVCLFCFSPNPNGFSPRQINKFHSNPQFCPLIKLFQDNLHVTAACCTPATTVQLDMWRFAWQLTVHTCTDSSLRLALQSAVFAGRQKCNGTCALKTHPVFLSLATVKWRTYIKERW